MLLRRVAVENVKSFLAREELILDGPISLLIGPNGGGKTNLLDIAVTMLRRFLFASVYPARSPRGKTRSDTNFVKTMRSTIWALSHITVEPAKRN